MTLSFTTHHNGKPTLFVEKIITALHPMHPGLPDVRPKLHTLRDDLPDRWEAGKTIHFVTGNRTPQRHQFAEARCISTQLVAVDPATRSVCVNKRTLTTAEVTTLAINDGFDTVDDFWQWFTERKLLKLIHWTDLRY